MHLYTAASHMVHRSLRLDPLLTRKDCGNAEWPSLLAHVTSSYNINSTIGPSQRSHHLVLPAIPGHIIICCHLQNSLQTYHSLIWHAHRSRIGTSGVDRIMASRQLLVSLSRLLVLWYLVGWSKVSSDLVSSVLCFLVRVTPSFHLPFVLLFSTSSLGPASSLQPHDRYRSADLRHERTYVHLPEKVLVKIARE